MAPSSQGLEPPGKAGRFTIESVHSRLRKIIKSRGHFPSDEAASKLIWLALRNITADWKRASKEWKSAMNQFAILYGDRFTLAPR
jgi:transposase-like protein